MARYRDWRHSEAHGVPRHCTQWALCGRPPLVWVFESRARSADRRPDLRWMSSGSLPCYATKEVVNLAQDGYLTLEQLVDERYGTNCGIGWQKPG